MQKPIWIIIGIGILSRLLPHPPNATAITASSVMLARHTRLPMQWLGILYLWGISDLCLILISSQFSVTGVSFVSYLTYCVMNTVITLLPWRPGRGTVMASVFCFWVASNAAVWYSGDLYPLTAQGLYQAYWQALPFLMNMLIAEIVAFSLFLGLESRYSDYLPDVPLSQVLKSRYNARFVCKG